MAVQIERDSKNALRFYITLPEGEVPPVRVRSHDLGITDAEKLLTQIKAEMAKNAAEILLRKSPKLRNLLPSGSYGDVKPYHVKRSKAGKTPAHYRVGMQVTFADPAHAAGFAKAVGIG